MSTWKIFTKILKKNRDQAFAGKPEERIDRNLPLGFRLGGLVSIDQSLFILNRDKLSFKSPGKEHYVQGFSKFSIMDFDYHRFYLESKEDKVAGPKEKLDPGEKELSIVQVVTDKSGTVEEIKLLRNFDQVMPENDEQWDEWLGDGGMIRDQVFVVEEDDGSDVEFKRVWGEGQNAEPISFTETIHTDPLGKDPLTLENSAMLFGRMVNEEEELVEYLMVSAEENSDEASVRMLVGLDIPTAAGLSIV